MENKKVIRTIGSVTGIMLLAKALAMLRSILQARSFGVGAEVDAFTLANKCTVSLFTTVCYALCIAAVPLFSRAAIEGKDHCFRMADRLLSNTLVLALSVTGGLVALGTVGLGRGPFWSYFLRLVPALPIIAVTYLLLALFQSMGHFTLQAGLSFLYNVALCAALLLPGRHIDLPSFALLTALCWLLQLAMTVPSIRKERYRFHFTPDSKGGEYRRFLRTGMTIMFSTAVFLLCYLINTHFAAAGEVGAAASFFYADRLYEPLATALIYSVGIVLFPDFSQRSAQMPPQEYCRYVVLALKDMMLLLLPLSALFSAFGPAMIRVLFEGGDFTAEDAVMCGQIFSLYALGLGGYFVLDLLTKAYYAMGRVRTPALIGLAVLLVCAVANVLCVRVVRERPQLLALGTSIGLLAVSAAAFVIFARKGGVEFPYRALLWSIVSSILLGLGARAAFLRFVADTASKGWSILQCCGIGAVGTILYLLVMSPVLPVREVWKKLRREKV